MAEDYVENGLEFLGHATGKHFDHIYDKIVGKPKSLPPSTKVKSVVVAEKNKENVERKSRRNSESYVRVRSTSRENYVYSRTGSPLRIEARPRRFNTLPALEQDIGRGQLLTEKALHRHEQVLPVKKGLLLEKALPPEEDLVLVYKSKSKARRDSAMASGYRDDYRESGYRGENNRPRSQPPRGRYEDDEDSDYDERSGDRQRGGGGRGYDDRDDYDTVREVREVYRGPVSAGPLALREAANRPWAPERNESGRSEYSEKGGPYGAGAVAQYSRRSGGDVSRTEITRRERSRGRDSYDSRSRSVSYSRSRSRSRSRSGSGIRGKLEETFSTRPRGLGAGLAGAVIGGLAGREFGQKHKNRDIVLGAIVGGLAANAGENKWTEYKDGKERAVERSEPMRYEGRSYDGRSRSHGR